MLKMQLIKLFFLNFILDDCAQVKKYKIKMNDKDKIFCMICHDGSDDNEIIKHSCCTATSHKICLNEWMGVCKNVVCYCCAKTFVDDFWKVNIDYETACKIIINNGFETLCKKYNIINDIFNICNFAVSHDGKNIKFMSESMQNCVEICKLAVKQNGFSI
jgi:hypothetical protein